jgi:hypothetical protein
MVLAFEKGARMIGTDVVLAVVATAVVVLGVQSIFRVRSRQRFRIARLNDREFLVTFEEPTDQEVALVAHAILRELGWKDSEVEGPIAPVLPLPRPRPSLPLDGTGRF